jgi:hypothetical protein
MSGIRLKNREPASGDDRRIRLCFGFLGKRAAGLDPDD